MDIHHWLEIGAALAALLLFALPLCAFVRPKGSIRR